VNAHRAYLRYAAVGDEESAFIARHAELISRLARRMAARTGNAVSADDLWSAGALGLLEASRRFDPNREVRFESFAEHRIRGAMLDELRRLDHLPRRLRTQLDEVERARAHLVRTLGREPGQDEVASALGVGLDELEALAGLAQPLLEILPNLSAASLPAEDAIARAELQQTLAAAIAGLPERLQLVLSLHYQESLTYREIAKVLDVSEPRVCQLHSEAVGLLRKALTER